MKKMEKENASAAENPLGSAPVDSLLVKFAVPSIIAMLVGALYNIVDQIFIGNYVGELGNAATNIAFPLSTLCTSTSLFFGIGGVVTFKNSKKLKRAVQSIPLDNIVLETDCPYLTPSPYRGERNDSRYLSYVAAEIARLKDISVEEVARTTFQNAMRLYNL